MCLSSILIGQPERDALTKLFREIEAFDQQPINFVSEIPNYLKEFKKYSKAASDLPCPTLGRYADCCKMMVSLAFAEKAIVYKDEFPFQIDDIYLLHSGYISDIDRLITDLKSTTYQHFTLLGEMNEANIYKIKSKNELLLTLIEQLKESHYKRFTFNQTAKGYEEYITKWIFPNDDNMDYYITDEFFKKAIYKLYLLQTIDGSKKSIDYFKSNYIPNMPIVNRPRERMPLISKALRSLIDDGSKIGEGCDLDFSTIADTSRLRALIKKYKDTEASVNAIQKFITYFKDKPSKLSFLRSLDYVFEASQSQIIKDKYTKLISDIDVLEDRKVVIATSINKSEANEVSVNILKNSIYIGYDQTYKVYDKLTHEMLRTSIRREPTKTFYIDNNRDVKEIGINNIITNNNDIPLFSPFQKNKDLQVITTQSDLIIAVWASSSQAYRKIVPDSIEYANPFIGREIRRGEVFHGRVFEDSDRANYDIYYSLKNKGGNWSSPKNIGHAINTVFDEITPYLTIDKIDEKTSEINLFFSSDGHGGFGGLDLYKAKLELSKKGNELIVNDVQNMSGLNTYANEKGYIQTDTFKFFLSDRDASLFNTWDIYTTTYSSTSGPSPDPEVEEKDNLKLEELKCIPIKGFNLVGQYTISGKIYKVGKNGKKEVAENATVTYIMLGGTVAYQATSSKNGYFSMDVNIPKDKNGTENSSIILRAVIEDRTIQGDLIKYDGEKLLQICDDPENSMLDMGALVVKTSNQIKQEGKHTMPIPFFFETDEYGKTINTNSNAITSYFETNTFNEKLQKGEFMIYINGYADISCNNCYPNNSEYNMNLSRQRALFVKKYFVETLGIPEKFIKCNSNGATNDFDSQFDGQLNEIEVAPGQTRKNIWNEVIDGYESKSPKQQKLQMNRRVVISYE